MDIPCERMQSAKVTASCSACRVWAPVSWLPVLDELAEFVPQAAITVAAAIAAVASARREGVLNIRRWYPTAGHTSATRPRGGSPAEWSRCVMAL